MTCEFISVPVLKIAVAAGVSEISVFEKSARWGILVFFSENHKYLENYVVSAKKSMNFSVGVTSGSSLLY